MYTLGINAVYHDSSACLVKDGNVLAAAEEERFTGIKHGKRPTPFSAYELPFHAMDFCLAAEGIDLSSVNHVAYSFDPYIVLGPYRRDKAILLPMEPSIHEKPVEWETEWDPLFLTHVVNAPRQLATGAPPHLKKRFPSGAAERFRWHFVDHHVAHAASAFYASPFERAAVLTLDGRGERATTTYSLGEGHRLDRLGEVEMPHSLGFLYEEGARFLGFRRSSDECNVMALSPYGRPKYLDELRRMIHVRDDGRFTIEEPAFDKRFGAPREKGEPLRKRHFDFAHSLQKALEETVLKLAKWLQKKTGCDDLCMAGGVALNSFMNARLRAEGPFKRVWVQPAAGEAGTALGAALWTDTWQRRESLNGHHDWVMSHAYLGPEFGDDEILSVVRRTKWPYRKMKDVAAETAVILAGGGIVGWFQGRMEFGPRALGARSILASPLKSSTKAKLNELKGREEFRSAAPVVLEDEADEWFERAERSPFMLFAVAVKTSRARRIPAVLQADGTARVQTVARGDNPLFYDLVRAFKKRTGVPVLVNTSFNAPGRPIVCSPRDAVECFSASPLDALVIGPYVLEKDP